MTYRVARIHDGKPFDWLHSESPDGSRHMVCTNPIGALSFDTYDAAADAAGRAMDRREGEEYRAVPGLTPPCIG